MKANKMCVGMRMPLPRQGWWFVLVAAAASVANAQSPTADSFNPWAQNGSGYALAVQGDGKVLLGGSYHNLGSGAAFQYRENIARLYADGTIEPVYNPGIDGGVYATLIQSDCRVVLGGNFKTCDGRSRTNLARLNPDGTLDTGFNAGVVTSAGSLPGVHALALQPADNKLLVAGGFSTCGGQSHANIARLNADGSGDGTFTPSTDGGVYAVALQTDGKILIGGNFSTVNGVLRTNLARLNPGGGLDTTFTAGAYIPNGFPWPYVVSCLAVQADGKILVGGQFNTVNDQPANGLARLDGTSGALDPTFTSGLTPLNLPTMYMPTVEGMAIQTDGNILVCGSIDALSGSLTKLIRLNSSGAADSSFYPMPNQVVLGMGLQADGKILAGGQFTMLGGTSRHGYGRLNNPSAASQSLTFNASSITWYRSGASPEVWRTTFEYSADGTTWTTTSGTRISGGWQKTGLSLPGNPCIRVRGHLTGGIHNGSSWFVENTAGKPFITVQPASRTNNAGSTTAFSVWAGGSPTLRYQWRKGTTSLTDGGKVSGVTNAILTITNVLGGDAGDYTVVITNLSGSVTSAVAVLRVIDPVILTQPQTVSTNVGATANFTVTAAGTPTLSYQWRKNGMDVANGTASSLAVTNVQAADSGSAFAVVVINGYGSVTSAVATLLVNMSLADNFNPDANNVVSSLALQTDGKILVGSDSASPFTTLNGQACTNFGRLTAAGILDTSFTRETSPSPRLSSITVQTNGQILAGGTFYKLGGQWRTNVAQLNPDGAANADFHPQANGTIYCTTLLTNGQMLVGGSFTTLAGQACTNLGRLNLDGSLDTSFKATANNAPYGLAVQPDGKIVVWGSFTTLNGVARNYIGRLAANGDLDSFNPNANNAVQCAALQPNGAVIFGGFFSQVNATPRSYLARVDQNGALDNTFTPGANNGVYSLALQADGRILAGGAFTTLGGQPAKYLGRLNANGTPDSLFIPNPDGNPDGSANCVALQRDGNILLAGAFTSVAGQPRNRIARLVNSDAATQSLTLAGFKVTWLRGGSSPEVYGASFGYSTDGTNWVGLGTATRVAGGWELPGVAITFTAILRARGLVAGGYRNNSAWVVETVQPPLIIVQPVSRTNAPGTVATFSVQAFGPALTYQWFKDGIGLSDVGNVSGAQTATLVLNNVSTNDRGGYSVLVTNIQGFYRVVSLP